MKTYFSFATPTKSDSFVQALQSAGYRLAPNHMSADFFLAEKESSTPWRRERMEKFINQRPIFFIPHTPYSFWIWDRWVSPMRVSCNFVNSPISVLGMREYKYPNRVEEIGWTRCKIKQFSPTHGNNLLYMPPARLDWAYKNLGTLNDLELHIKTLDWIVSNRKYFDHVTLHFRKSMTDYLYDDLPGGDYEFFDMGSGLQLSAQAALEGVERACADLVISSNTAGYICLASGIPTVLFNNFRGVPTTCATGGGHHWDLYKQHYEFPLTLLEMSPNDLLSLRDAPNGDVEEWRKWNIGKPFDAEKFLSVVGEFA